MNATATDGAGTATATATTDANAGTGAAGAQQAQAQQAAPTLESLQAQIAALTTDNEKWKALSRKNETRAESNAAAAQQQAEQQQLLAKVAQALGLQEAAPDPAKITAQLETAQRDAKSRSVELAVLRTAARLDADGDALLDSRTFLAAVGNLEPGDSAGIEAAITAAVAAAPAKFGRGRTAATNGATGTTAEGGQQSAAQQASTAASAGQFNGTAGGKRQWTKADVDRASAAELSKAMDEHLLDSYLAS